MAAHPENEIDMVFLDLNMPIMDGCETCRRFREFESAYRLAQNDYDNYVSSMGNDNEDNNNVVVNATSVDGSGAGAGAGAGLLTSTIIGGALEGGVPASIGTGVSASIVAAGVGGTGIGSVTTPGTADVPMGLVPSPNTPLGMALAAFPGIAGNNPHTYYYYYQLLLLLLLILIAGNNPSSRIHNSKQPTNLNSINTLSQHSQHP